MSKKHYPVRIPRYAAGIRAQESRSGGARTWWARRWVEVLERMGLGARLGRGKHYAVSGQVTGMRLEGPHVEAQVVGTRPDPYRVTIDFRVPEGAAREAIVSRIKGEPMMAARLIADDMPTEVEQAFRDCARLLPGRKARARRVRHDDRVFVSGLRQPLQARLRRAAHPGRGDRAASDDAPGAPRNRRGGSL